MTRNITIRMDEELLRQVRHKAVDENISTSRWIVGVLERAVVAKGGDDAVRRRALRRLEEGFSLGGTPLSREQAHAR